MDGTSTSLVELAALPAVGATLLDPRPAFVFAADGTRVLFANAAGITLLATESFDALASLRFTSLNPVRAQIARLARVLPTETSRLEIFRFGGGATSTTVTAACRRLNYGGDQRAVLAVGVGAGPAESLRTRAERLTQAIAGPHGIAVVIDAEGATVAVTPEYVPRPMSDDMHGLADAARAAPQRYALGTNGAGPQSMNVGAVEFRAGEHDLMLVVAQPLASRGSTHFAPEPEPDLAPEPEAAMDAPGPEAAAPAASSALSAAAPAEAAPPAEAEPIRFAFALDADGRFRAVAPELAKTVGDENGALDGHAWAELAGRFGAPGDAITRALALGTGFSAHLPWPSRAGEALAVELTAIPDPATGGYLGFGRIGSLIAGAPLTPLSLRAPTPPTVQPVAPLLRAETALHELAPDSPVETPADQPPATASGATAEPASAAEETPAVAPPSNIVRLPGTEARMLPEPLSGNERDAFRRIAQALGRPTAEAAPPAPTPAPAAAAPAGDVPQLTAAPATIDPRLLDRLPVGIAISRDRRTLFANRTLIELLGYETMEAFLAAGGADAVFPGEAVFPGSEGMGDRAGLPDRSIVARRSDGSEMEVRAWLHAVMFDGATALMLSVAGVDGDHALADALAQSQARADELEAILDTATDGVIVIDRRGRTESMNHAAEALFGVDASLYFGRYFTDLLADESQKAALEYLDGLLSNGVASVLNDGREVIGRTPSGGLIPLFMTMGRIGTSEKFCAVLRDITHWKNVEEELVAARRSAEAANTQKSDFLAKISHEIRTPLNAIIGFSEVMASERFGPVGNERYRQYLRDIHLSGAHLMSLINDLLDLSKIEAGKVDLAFEAVPVNAAIQESVALMQPQANRERIIIRTSLAADVPSVVADPRSLRQILLNLLSNAVKFTRAGGQVIVSSSLEGTGEVVVRVRDTGIGMSEKDIETALKPFRQVAPAREDRDHRDQGTGLGLPLTKALVEANRATFAIDSAPNQGTLVKITFPTTRVLAG